MHMLVVVEKENERDRDFSMFLGTLAPKAKRARNTDRLAENVWLVDMRRDPAFLGWLISLANAQGIPFRLLPLEKQPEWLTQKP